MSLSFKDLVELDEWKNIQTRFSQVLRIKLSTVDLKGNFIVGPASFNQFCDDIIRENLSAALQCENCERELFLNSVSDWRQGYKCVFGLYSFLIPVVVEKEPVAYIAAGPVILGKYKLTDEISSALVKAGISLVDFQNALTQVRTVSFSRMQTILDLLYDIGSYVCGLGLKTVEETNLFKSRVKVLDHVYDFYLDKMLETLLDVSCRAVKADRGSVMLLDEKKEALYIKNFRGLDKDIAAKTRVLVGQGLAGMVAKEGKALSLDDTVKDARVLSRMKNPSLKQAFLIPIKIKSKLIGVLNLATTKINETNQIQSSQDMVNNLTDLVAVTLSELNQTFG
ncbi:MAG: PocR ligand-binding domain-containing protein [Candidatus Omnitrophica bacterium]|nr:PocR ligand-binding domain-containing protein [Candidatus Omnitrophota bacterium]